MSKVDLSYSMTNSICLAIADLKSPVKEISRPTFNKPDYSKTDQILKSTNLDFDENEEQEEEDEICSENLNMEQNPVKKIEFLKIFSGKRRIFRIKDEILRISTTNFDDNYRHIFENSISRLVSCSNWTDKEELLYKKLLEVDSPPNFLPDFNFFILIFTFLGGDFLQYSNEKDEKIVVKEEDLNFNLIRRILILFAQFLINFNLKSLQATQRLDFCLIFIVISLDANLVYDPICQSKLDHVINNLVESTPKDQIRYLNAQICRNFFENFKISIELVEILCRKFDRSKILISHLCFEASVFPKTHIFINFLSLLQIFRHGDRNAQTLFPTDVENTVETWSGGLGELTPLGVKQQYELGKFIKNRYRGFLSEKYSAKEIYVRSTSYNRTLMSAAANLAGMYPPVGNQIWDQNLLWQPIPVHSVPREYDPVLWMDKPCPTVSDLYKKKVFKSESYTKVERENADFLAFLSNKTGIKNLPLLDMWSVFDSLNCETIHNDTHKRPEWVTEDHDTTQVALLENMNAYDGLVPTYDQTYFMELHEINDSYFVTVLKRNSTDGNRIFVVEIPSCGQFCDLKKFYELSLFNKPQDWNEECGLVDENKLEEKTEELIGILAGLCILFFVLFIVLLAFYCRARRTNWAVLQE
uniref:acid phosphatase n=1 Tax=Romanomermis culicivorax TaxID=13658 RepID=A0A915I5F1_ROMCU